jgi:hypothetical protein
VEQAGLSRSLTREVPNLTSERHRGAAGDEAELAEERRNSGRWWNRATLYRIHLASFRDSDVDGVGDLGGVMDTLPYLDRVLGVGALSISPFMDGAQLTEGDGVIDHTGIASRFGDLATFEGDH